MASFDTLVPFVLHWETGARITAADTPQTAFARAAARGVKTVAGDSGGPTLCGVTLATFRAFTHRPAATEADLARMTYPQWRAIAKSGFWDRCRADQITHQGIANMLVDWMYNAGPAAIFAAQRALGLKADGIVGPKTLTALNAPDPLTTFHTLKTARLTYYNTRSAALRARFLTGWLARTEAITPTALLYR